MGSPSVARLARSGAVLAVLALVLGTAGPAAAAGPEQITSYDTAITVEPSGVLDITETIAYDFGANSRHGIIRKIPARFHYDDKHDRLYPISDVHVTQDGHAATVATDAGNYYVIKIGDANKTLTGKHTYVIAYHVAYGINAFPDHDELYWNAVGVEWTVPVLTSSATVTTPAAITDATCYAGPENSRLNCTSHNVAGSSATFSEAPLGPSEGLTVVVAVPGGTVAQPGPKLVERRTLAAAFALNPWTIGGGLLLLLLGVGGALLIGFLVGRDRRYVGLLPGLVPEADDPNVEARKPLVGAPPVSVEFTPPGNLRPGQVGTLIDEQANTVDVTATIVEFAVRRLLRIEEVPGARRNDRDWRLVKLTDGDPHFLPYERRLFDAIFAGGKQQVLLSELKYHFATELAAAQRALYADMVAQGWYRQSPQRTRQAAYALAIAALIASVVITGVLAAFTHAALLGIGLIAGAIVLLAVAGKFPARTGRGSAALARVQGFRLYVATAETDQIAFQEREQIFSRYLPYAMVFGLVDRWAGVFKDLAAEGSTGLYWYTGAPNWSMLYFAQSIGAFTTTTTGTIASTMPTSSSGSGVFGGSGFGGGFSGGGGGGGGGGSW